MSSGPTLAELLRIHLDPDFPVSSGDGKADNPLIITETRDYVAIEHATVRHVMGMIKEEYQLTEQRLLNRSGRVVDELVFDVKPIGAPEWTGRRRFFFDITAGFGIK